MTPRPTVDRSALLAAAPELTEESAAVVIASAPDAAIDVVARASLMEGTRGFAYLTTVELRELGAIFERAYRPLSGGQRQRLESYLGTLRAGALAAAEDEAEARASFNGAVTALPAEDRRRLQALYARAIEESQSARRRAALPPQQVPRPGSPGGWPAGSRYVPSPSPTPIVPVEVERSSASMAEQRRLEKELALARRAVSRAKSQLAGVEQSLRNAREHRDYVSRRVAASSQLDAQRSQIDSLEKQVQEASRALSDAEADVRRFEALLVAYR